MKLSIYITLLAFAGMMGSSYGQELKKEKIVVSAELQRQKAARNFYRNSLQIDSAKAARVSQVQDAYKAGMKAIVADTSLNPAAKRARIQALMEVKNQQLRSMLSPAQQEKMIPSTERTPVKPAQ